MTIPREKLDADKQPVWTAPNERKEQRYRWNRPEKHKGRGVIAFLSLIFGGFLALIGLSQK